MRFNQIILFYTKILHKKKLDDIANEYNKQKLN